MSTLTIPAPATHLTSEPELVPAVEVRDLHFHYGTSDGSLHDVSFKVEEFESVAVIGPNGAGKSTLLLHLNGILPERNDSGGSVYIFGRRVTQKTAYEIRRDVGLLFQDPDDQLFCPTVFEDVAFGPRQYGLPAEQIAQRVKRCLEQVGLSGLGARCPNRLSGGEKRRVCLAGVLACEPRVLVLDEPSTNLDPRGRREFIAMLARLPATKIIATHDLEMVTELCPRALVLDAGRVVAQGCTSALLSDEPLMLAHGLEVPASIRR